MAETGLVSPRPVVRFQLLDPLRGLAALWVLTFHYGFSAQFVSTFPWVNSIFLAGHLGVPMFFVISGYSLMAAVRVARRDGESTAAFLRRRSLRIYPPYWCSVLVIAAVPFVIEALSALKTGTFVWPSASGNLNLGYLDFGPIEWARVLTLTQVFAPLPDAGSLQAKFTTINAVYWTLAIEVQFYLVMAAALAAKARAGLVLGMVTLISLPLWYLGIWSVSGVFLPYWPMFAIGIALYLVLERNISPGALTGARWLSLAPALAMTLVFLSVTLLGHPLGDVGFAAGFAVVLWCLNDFDRSYAQTLRSGTPAARLTLTVSRTLGLMSYSLYLVHGRLQFLAQQLCRQLLASGIAFDAAAIGLTCAMCYVFYRCCEKPFIPSRPALNLSAQR